MGCIMIRKPGACYRSHSIDWVDHRELEGKSGELKELHVFYSSGVAQVKIKGLQTHWSQSKPRKSNTNRKHRPRMRSTIASVNPETSTRSGHSSTLQKCKVKSPTDSSGTFLRNDRRRERLSERLSYLAQLETRTWS